MKVLHLAVASAVFAGLVLGCASGGRWLPNEPIPILPPSVHSADVYDALIKRSRAIGYDPETIDPSAGFFKVKAHIHDAAAIARGVQPRSFFTVQLESNRSVTLRANGYHVRGDVMHRNLHREFEYYAEQLSLAVAELGPTP